MRGAGGVSLNILVNAAYASVELCIVHTSGQNIFSDLEVLFVYLPLRDTNKRYSIDLINLVYYFKFFRFLFWIYSSRGGLARLLPS